LNQAPINEEPPAAQRRRGRRFPIWPFVVAAVLVGLGMGTVWAWGLILPFYALSPGPVEQVIDLISIEEDEVEVFPPEGDLYFLTVQLQPVNVYEYVEAWADPRVDVVEREAVRPQDITEEQMRELNLDLMEESKTFAVCVALNHLEIEARCEGQGVAVGGLVEGVPAAQVLQKNDVIVAIDGEPVELATDAVAIIGQREIGETLTLTVLRDGQGMDVEVELVEHVEEPGRPMVGFLPETVALEVDLPFDVQIDSHNVGGPSAGMMYALGVIDLLSEGSLTAGHLVAGTGTISLDEEVGSVGGVRQKVFAARAAGADVVLVPEGNYQEALGAAGGQIQVVAVRNLDDALAFLATLDQS
jgi:PDZ domain-containing protein